MGRNGGYYLGVNHQALFRFSESSRKRKPLIQLEKDTGENSQRNPVFPARRESVSLLLSNGRSRQKRHLSGVAGSQAAGRRILVADGQFALGRDPESQDLLSAESTGR